MIQKSLSHLIINIFLMVLLIQCHLVTLYQDSIIVQAAIIQSTTTTPTLEKSSSLPNIATNNNNDSSSDSTFATTYQLQDGELITKLKWNNLKTIETRYNHLDLIQMINNGKQVLQFWLSNGEMVDCEYTNDTGTIEHIHNEFQKVNPNMRKDSKHYLKLLEEHKNLTITLPDHLKRLTDYENYIEQCSQLHEKVRNHYEQNAATIINKKRPLSRTKRDSLLLPGTKWCGKGSNGKNFEDLGDYSFADSCCRDHDRCKYSIGPFDTRYHLFNIRFHYVSHCSCDERFRSCLKVANSGTANMVGKIFFNVVHTNCFMFKMDDVCVAKTWWGTCLKTKRMKRAVLRDPMPY